MNETITIIVHRRWWQRFPLIGLFFDWLDKRKWIGRRVRAGSQERTVIGYKDNTITIDRAWESQPGSNDNFIVTFEP